MNIDATNTGKDSDYKAALKEARNRLGLGVNATNVVLTYKAACFICFVENVDKSSWSKLVTSGIREVKYEIAPWGFDFLCPEGGAQFHTDRDECKQDADLYASIAYLVAAILDRRSGVVFDDLPPMAKRSFEDLFRFLDQEGHMRAFRNVFGSVDLSGNW